MPPHGDDTQIAEARPGLPAHQRYEAQRHQVQQAVALADSRRAGADLLAVAASAFRERKAEVEVAAVRKPVNGPAGVLNASGYITPRRRATIAAKITGRVTSVMFDEGTRVTEGQLLASLDDSDTRRALDSAKLTVTPHRRRLPTTRSSFAMRKSNSAARNNS